MISEGLHKSDSENECTDAFQFGSLSKQPKESFCAGQAIATEAILLVDP